MSGWLISLPSWLLLIGLEVVIVGGALSIRLFLQRRFPALAGESHNDILKFTYGFIGFVYAFIVGFVVSSMWGQINTADAEARAEGAAAVQIARDSTAFEVADHDRVQQSLLAYVRSSIDEWSHSAAQRAPGTDAALGRVYAAYAGVRAGTEQQKTLLATSYSNLDAITQARSIRIFTAREDTGPPWPLWTVIVLTSVMVIGTVVIYGDARPRLLYSMVVIVGTIVATNLFLMLELSHPYLGVISTSPDPLQEAVSMLSRPAP